MSRIITILLCSAFLIQTGFKVILYLDYQVNKEEITKKHCVNKDKPKMNCHGKCHLNKMMKEDSECQEQNKNSGKVYCEFSPFTLTEKKLFRDWETNNRNNYFRYILGATRIRTTNIFHPPSA